MSESSERYTTVAAAFAARISGVPADRWSAPSPCTEWTARDVLAHVIGVHRYFAVGLDAGTPLVSATDDDLGAAWAAATADIQSIFADPERASATVTGPAGPMPLEQMIGRVLCADTLTHTWDIARATGQDEHLDPAGVTFAFALLLPNDEAIRGPGSFGPKVDPPPGADEQTRYLCFLGRRV